MKYLIIVSFIFFSSCMTPKSASENKQKTFHKSIPINVSFSDIDQNNDQNITLEEFKNYKNSTKNSLASPNIDYKTPLIICGVILGSILFFCFMPKLLKIIKDSIDLCIKKSKDLYNERYKKK